MTEKLSILEAYTAMFVFVENYYYHLGKPAELGTFLSDIQLIKDGKPLDLTMWLTEDGKPLDPAMWKEWLDAVSAVVNRQ